MNIVVLVKQVPDTWSERRLVGSDHVLDRESADAVLDEIDERAVEEALRLREALGGGVTVVCMGPGRASEAVRKALSMGADEAVHLCDDRLAGSDVVSTARALTGVLALVESVEVVLAGAESTDGRAGAVPAMVAELWGAAQVTCVRSVSVEAGVVTAERETDAGVCALRAAVPVVVSVTEKVNEPRYPSFKGIMAAKKKPVRTVGLDEVGLAAEQVGLAGASSRVTASAPAPPKEAGQRVTDEGDGAGQILRYLISHKLV